MNDVIDAYFAAMRRGPDGESDLLSLFTLDVEYIEPFSGIEEAAVGIDEVRARFRKGWEQPPPDLELIVLQIESSGTTATARWECRSPAFSEPVQGTDRYTFDNDRISRLEVSIDPKPENA